MSELWQIYNMEEHLCKCHGLLYSTADSYADWKSAHVEEDNELVAEVDESYQYYGIPHASVFHPVTGQECKGIFRHVD